MFKRNEKYYALLVPYLEGGLDDVRAADLRARLGDDPALAAEAERLRLTLSSLRETSRRTPAPNSAAVPADLWPRLRDRLDPAPTSRRAVPAGWLAAVGAAAAVAFAAIWMPIGHPRESARIVSAPRPRSAAPRSAAKGPERMAYAPKSEAVRPAILPLTATASPKSAVPAPVPVGSKAAASKPIPVPPPASGHDPFAVASADGTKAGPKPAVLPPVPAPPVATHTAAALPPAKKPTLIASRLGSSAHGDGVAGVGNLMPSRPASPMFALPVPLTMNRIAPSPSAAPAAPAGGGFGGGVGGQVRNGASAFDSDARAAAGARGFAVQKTQEAQKTQQRIKSSGPVVNLGMSAYRARTEHAAKAVVPAGGADRFQPSPVLDAGQALDAWQSSLSQAVQPPLLGQESGAQQANQALMSARESGSLDALRERLEARRAQAPRDLSASRMLASVYDFAFSAEAALRERRRLVTLDGATGEDWFALAEAEGHAGNGQAARAAYRRALDAPAPLSGFHAQIAKARG